MPRHGLAEPPADFWREYQTTLPVSPPAAGNNLVIPIEAPYASRLAALFLTFTADANVGNRFLACQVLNSDGAVMGHTMTATAYTAAQAGDVAFMADTGATGGTAPDAVAVPAPALWLFSGMALRVKVYGIKAGDAFTSVAATFWRYPLSPAVARAE